MDIVNRPLPKTFMKTKTARAPILWIARNCNANNGRHHYIKELMKYIEVDSFGSCLNSADFPEDRSRTELMGEYKFYLAVENSNCENYATEKLYDTFLNSAVPIVDGPPSYLDYIPNNRSVIHMDAYPDPRDLADYINYLDQNDTAYLAYLNYRRDAVEVPMRTRLNPQFLNRWSDEREFQLTSDYCSICHGILPWWTARTKKTPFDKDRGREERFRVDQTCGESNKWGYAVNGPPYTPSWTPRERDEFTRPVEETIMDEVEVVQPKEQYPYASPVLEAHVLFVGFFLLFIVFLWRQAKKSRRVVETSDV
ncbi:glycosyltransferase family 10 protein [Backusella circina FSU 941]|nr:glycosyltransferase family 10 protein [Backusella circina FSU 941]